MAGEQSQSTVAASETPALRASVNAVPGPASAVHMAAKVGNATPISEVERTSEWLGGERKAGPLWHADIDVRTHRSWGQ